MDSVGAKVGQGARLPHMNSSGNNRTLVEDASGFRGEGDEIVTPGSEADVIAFLERASKESIPVTVAGAGTGVTGGRVPQRGALLSLEKLNRLEIREGSAIAGAGVLLADLHAAAAGRGQFYPPDPTETSAAIGGPIATNASGSRSFLHRVTPPHRPHLALLPLLLPLPTLPPA